MSSAVPRQTSVGSAEGGIRHARETGTPFLGTCGGFQHALIEFARGVLRLLDAEHAETSPDAERLLISPLSCSLVGVTGTIKISGGTLEFNRTGGALAALLASAGAGAAVGTVLGALIGLGIPEEESKFYESEFTAGRTLVTVRAGSRNEDAWRILNRHGAHEPATTGAAYGTGVEGTPY